MGLDTVCNWCFGSLLNESTYLSNSLKHYVSIRNVNMELIFIIL